MAKILLDHDLGTGLNVKFWFLIRIQMRKTSGSETLLLKPYLKKYMPCHGFIG